MPTSKQQQQPTMPKPQRAGRETSWGMMDILADMEKRETQSPPCRGAARTTRTSKLAARAAAATPSSLRRASLKGRESSWGFVDVMELLDREENNDTPTTASSAPPPIPPKGSFARQRSTSRGSRPAIIKARQHPQRP